MRRDRFIRLLDYLIGTCLGAAIITIWPLRHMEAERDELRAKLAHYQEVTHTTPPLCVEAEVSP